MSETVEFTLDELADLLTRHLTYSGIVDLINELTACLPDSCIGEDLHIYMRGYDDGVEEEDDPR